MAMHESIASRRSDIAALCRRLGIRRLDLIGSATGDDFDESRSDSDFVVEFEGGTGFDYFDAYFSLREGLEALLGRPVDIVTRAGIRNPYFLRRVQDTEERVYAS